MAEPFTWNPHVETHASFNLKRFHQNPCAICHQLGHDRRVILSANAPDLEVETRGHDIEVMRLRLHGGTGTCRQTSTAPHRPIARRLRLSQLAAGGASATGSPVDTKTHAKTNSGLIFIGKNAFVTTHANRIMVTTPGFLAARRMQHSRPTKVGAAKHA